MALATTLSFANFLVYLGDGATPENFYTTSSAAFTDHSLKCKTSTGSTEVPDTGNPALPSVEELEAKMLSLEVAGSGVLDMLAVNDWVQWWIGGQPRDIRVMLNATGALGGGYFATQGILSDFSPGAKKGEKCSISVTIVSTGPITWTPNP